MLEAFKAYLAGKIENEKSASGYAKDVEQFLAFIGEEGVKIAQAKETHIKKFNLSLAEKGYSKHTVARKSSALRRYFKFLRTQGLMVANPMEDVKQPALEKRRPEFGEEDAKRLEERAEACGARDLLLVALAVRERVKPSEAVKIKAEDYEKTHGVLYVGKRALRASERTKSAIEAAGAKEGTMLQNSRGEALSEAGAYFILKGHLKAIGRDDLRPIDLCKKREN